MGRFSDFLGRKIWVGTENRIVFSLQFGDAFGIQLKLSEYARDRNRERIITTKEEYHQLIKDILDEGIVWGISADFLS